MGVALGVGAIAGQVNIVSLANNTVLANSVASATPASVETTVVTYTNATKAVWITQIFCSGQENSKWRFFQATIPKIVQRIGAGQVNVMFDFVTPYKVPANTAIDVKVTHYVTGETPDFECSIVGYEEA